MASIPSVQELNALETDACVAALEPLFEGAPRFVARLTDARPFESDEDLFDTARATAREMPEEEQIELLEAHPRIGADPAAISTLSRREQGYEDASSTEEGWVGEELTALNEAYEARFGFRFVVFVAGRPRADIIPLLERAAQSDRDEELRRGLDDVILIATDRLGGMRGPRPLREELREAIALEISRWMVGELDRDGVIRATHRLIDEGFESPALLALSLAQPGDESALTGQVNRLMGEIGLGGWDSTQAGQLLALHAAASILGEVTAPIDGARRIAAVSANPAFRTLVERWDAKPDGRDGINGEIRRAAVELFGEEDASDEA